MIRGLFVTGTDTGVGKTVVSAALLARYCPTVALRYWKPIQTGIEQDDDTEEIRRLTAPSLAEILDDGIRLPNPVSPHLAAKMAQSKRPQRSRKKESKKMAKISQEMTKKVATK